jgi:hypothetical protein
MEIVRYSENKFKEAMSLVKDRCVLMTDFQKELSWLHPPGIDSTVIIDKEDGSSYIFGVKINNYVGKNN